MKIDYSGRQALLLPITFITWFIVIGILFWLLGHISHTIIVMFIAALIAYTLLPAARFLNKYMPRIMALILIYVVILSIIGIVIYMIARIAVIQMNQLTPALHSYLKNIHSINNSPVGVALRNAGISNQQLTLAGNQLINQGENLTKSVLPYLEKVISTIIDIFLVSVLSIYILLDGEKIAALIKANIPNSQKSRFFFLLNTFDTVLGGYLRGQTALAVIIGLLIGFGMWFLHVPYAALLGILAFFFAYIPTIGTITSGVVCVALALTQGLMTALITLVYFVVMHFIESDILGPKIVGKELGIHPAISILAVVAGNELFGIIGMLVASPVAGIVQTISYAIWKDWKLTHPEEFSTKKRMTKESGKKRIKK